MPHLFLIALLIAAQQPGTGPMHPGSVGGIVLDANGKPLPGATVFGLPEDDMRHELRTTTNADGQFTLEGVPPGAVYLDAFKEQDGYPYNFFSFFKTSPKTPIKVNVQAGGTTKGATLQLGPKAARLDIEITGENGNPVNGAVELSFTRDDIPGTYRQSFHATDSFLVPPVPFTMTATAPGYKASDPLLLHPLSDQILHIAVRLTSSAKPAR